LFASAGASLHAEAELLKSFSEDCYPFSEKIRTGEIAYKELQPTTLDAANLARRMQYEI
jgi:hypothetical protein